MSRRVTTVVYDGEVELSEHGARALDDFAAAKAEIAKLEEVAENAKAIVQDELGEAEAGTVDGKVVVTWTKSEAMILDQKRLRTDMGAALNPWIRPSPRRTFKVVE